MYVNKDSCGGGAGVKGAAVGGDAMFSMLPSAGPPEGLQGCKKPGPGASEEKQQ